MEIKKQIEKDLLIVRQLGGKINLEEKKARIYDFKARKENSQKTELRQALKRAEKNVIELISTSKDTSKTTTNQLYKYTEELKQECNEQNRTEILKTLAKAEDALENIEKKKDTIEGNDIKKISLKLPKEIRDEMLDDFQELESCYQNDCYKSALILCGRILETSLYRKYYDVTKNDLLETAPQLGLGKIIAKLREKKVELPPGLTEQIHLINNIRILSVHKKKKVFKPSKNQTKAIILFTIDVVKKVF